MDLVLVALVVRFVGIDHEVEERAYADEGTYYHHASEILRGELLTRTFVYPHLTYYLYAFVLWLGGLFPGVGAGLGGLYGVTESLGREWLLLRAVVALLSAATVIPVFAIAERLGSKRAGVLGGLLFVFSPLFGAGSHLIISDVPSACLATWCLLFVARLVDEERSSDYLAAGAFSGLAAAAKYPAGVVAVAIVAVWLLWRLRDRSLRLGVVWAGLASLAAFLLFMPSLFAFPRQAFFGGRGIFFGVRQYAAGEWLGVVRESNAEYYSGQLAASFGWIALAVGALGLVLVAGERRRAVLWMLPFSVAYLLLISSMKISVERNLQPVVPVLCALIGVGLANVAERLQQVPRLAPALRRGLAIGAVATALAQPLVWTVLQDVALARASTRELAESFLLERLPPGARLVVDGPAPRLPPDRLATRRARFVGRVPLAELETQDNDVVILSAGSYARFLEPRGELTPHQREVAERYREILERYPKIAEFRPGLARAGPALEVFEVPVGEPAAARSWSAEAFFVPDPAMRAAGFVGLRYTRAGQWSVAKAVLAPGCHELALDGEPRGELRVEVRDLHNTSLGSLGDGGKDLRIDLPTAGKYFFYVRLPAGGRLYGGDVRRCLSAG